MAKIAFLGLGCSGSDEDGQKTPAGGLDLLLDEGDAPLRKAATARATTATIYDVVTSG